MVDEFWCWFGLWVGVYVVDLKDFDVIDVNVEDLLVFVVGFVVVFL